MSPSSSSTLAPPTGFTEAHLGAKKNKTTSNAQSSNPKGMMRNSQAPQRSLKLNGDRRAKASGAKRNVSRLENKPTTVKLQSTDLKRLVDAATVLSEDQVEVRRRAARDQAIRGLEERRKRENEEHQHRIAAAREQLQRECAELTEQQTRERNTIVERAAKLQEDQIDEVKRMNQLVDYALCATLRSKQLQEKEAIQTHKKLEEQALDAAVAETQQEKTKYVLEREESHKKLLREGAALIRQQIAERDEQRVADKAKHDEEVRQTLEQIKQLQEAERAEREMRQRAQHALLDEISKINSATIEAKRRMKAQAQEEDAKIMAYLLKKEASQAEMEARELEKKQRREKEIAELRSMQQKAGDIHAEMDTLRAQKAAFEYEQECRRKESEAKAKKINEQRELRDERERQRNAREQAIVAEAHKLREEFNAAVRHQEHLDARMKAKEVELHETRKHYIEEVSAQITDKAELRKKVREEFFQEGEKIAVQQRVELERLESIRERKLAELKSLGVPEIFMTELKKLRFTD